jgi:hypothetical protein
VEAIGKDSMLHQAIVGVSRIPPLKIAKWNFTGVSEY